MMGAMNIIDAVHSLDEFKEQMNIPCRIEVKAVPCMQACKANTSLEKKQGPFVKVNGKMINQAESENVMAEIMKVCEEG